MATERPGNSSAKAGDGGRAVRPYGSAFCLSCGALKEAPEARCVRCGFEPTSPDEYARSLVLCEDFQLDSVGLPLDPDELDHLREKIVARTSIEWDEDMLAEVKSHVEEMERFGASKCSLPLMLGGVVVLISGFAWLIRAIFF